MTDIESARTGYTKLYHPRGPLVSLPVVGDTPAAMFAYVTACLDAGFVVAAPGLEEGEQKEMVSGVLRSAIEQDGDETPFVLLYLADESTKFSFLKVYLNSDADVKACEQACGIRLDAMPVYEGKDKPERDGGKVATKFIAKLHKPVGVVYKANPKWNEEEANAAKAQNKLYAKAKRVFVRWADAPAPTAAQPPGDGTPPLTDVAVAESAWKARLAGVQVLDDLNNLMPMVKAVVDADIRKRAWTMCLDFADGKKWVFDKDDKKCFRHAAEMTASPPPPAPAPVAPPATPPPASAPPPPPDEPASSPLVAAWQKRLDPSAANLAKLNGELMTHFRSIGKTEADRGKVWIMLVDFAKANGFDLDQSTWKFVEKMP